MAVQSVEEFEEVFEDVYREVNHFLGGGDRAMANRPEVVEVRDPVPAEQNTGMAYDRGLNLMTVDPDAIANESIERSNIGGAAARVIRLYTGAPIPKPGYEPEDMFVRYLGSQVVSEEENEIRSLNEDARIKTTVDEPLSTQAHFIADPPYHTVGSNGREQLQEHWAKISDVAGHDAAVRLSEHAREDDEILYKSAQEIRDDYTAMEIGRVLDEVLEYHPSEAGSGPGF